jgi:RHS repeat-associated protein
VFVYDEAGRLIGEYDNYGRARNEHIWLADRPVAMLVYTYSGNITVPHTTTTYSVESDHIGTPRMITDATQAPRWSWHSAPYGDTLPNEKPGAAAALVYNLRLPGQYFDKETNTHYNWHRDYEATTGRYIQSDPIGLKGGINPYTYADGNPLSKHDPKGLAALAYTICSSVNLAWGLWDFSKTLKELNSTSWLQSQVIRVDSEMQQCPSDNTDRLAELDRMKRELLLRLASQTSEIVGPRVADSFKDAANELIIRQGLCAIALALPL